MIINAGTILLTLLVVAVALYGGLQLVRKFALEIAQENHDAVTAMDQRAEDERLRKERAADAAAASAFAKVQPILSAAAANSNNPATAQTESTGSKTPLRVTPSTSPTSATSTTTPAPTVVSSV